MPYKVGWISASNLREGDILLLPFDKKATITGVKVGTQFVTLTYEEYPSSRIGIYDRVNVIREMEAK